MARRESWQAACYTGDTCRFAGVRRSKREAYADALAMVASVEGVEGARVLIANEWGEQVWSWRGPTQQTLPFDVPARLVYAKVEEAS